MTLDATFWVTISFFIFLLILVYFKIPQKIKDVLNQNILSIKKQIYNLSMISPISVEEKQKLIETIELSEIINTLNDITKFNFYEDAYQKKILQ